MCFKMLMWTILVLGSYLQGAYAQSDKTTSSTSTYTKTISNTTPINSSLVESSSQSIPSTISITTIITSKLPSAENSTTGPTIPAKTEASGTSTNSIPTDPQSATVSTNIPEFKDTSKISTLASNTQFPSTNVTASTILTSEVTKGTDAPSDQSNSPETVTISRPTELHLTTNKESLVNHITADGISTTNSKTETATTAATTSAAAAAATTTSAKATTITAAATTSAKATTTSAAAATVAAPAAPAATTTRTAATTTRTAATRTTTRTAAAAAARNTTSTITTTSIKPQPQAMEPKLIPYLQMEITPNSSGNNYEKLCALLIKINRKTVNCTMNGHEIDGVFRVESIQLPSLPSVKDQKHPTPATPTKPVDSGEPTEKQGEDTQMTLIAILASCGALALILIAFAVYCSCHRLSYRKNQQHLTEELQTIENGYHDNPTLEVMEVQPEVQEKKFALEKKLALNGEFNDSWIVPFDNLAKEDIPDEEDTHL